LLGLGHTGAAGSNGSGAIAVGVIEGAFRCADQSGWALFVGCFSPLEVVGSLQQVMD
jgi:hypothetical protein